jgi:hypothetical protein
VQLHIAQAAYSSRGSDKKVQISSSTYRVQGDYLGAGGSLRCTSKLAWGNCYSAVNACTRINTPRTVIVVTDAGDENHEAFNQRFALALHRTMRRFKPAA